MFIRTLFEIGRIIEGLKEDRDRLIEREKTLSVFSAFDGEDKETVRPEYDYDEDQEKKNNPYRAEYEYINYDRKRIEEEYLKTKAELERIKMCVDFYIYELSYDSEV